MTNSCNWNSMISLRVKLHFDIWRRCDELHLDTTARSLMCFQHISYYHVAFQKPSLARPTRVKGRGTSCIRNSTSKSPLLTRRYRHTSGTHIHAKPQAHTPFWEHCCDAETSRRAVPTVPAGFRAAWTELWPQTWQLRRQLGKMTDTCLKHSA